mgnify:FL=1
MNTTTRNEIVRLLSNMDMEELKETNLILRDFSKMNQIQCTRTFKVGELVQFLSRKTMQQGTVIRLNRGTVVVKANGTTWRVDSTLLQKVSV